MFYQTNHTQPAEITPRQRWNGAICCRMMLFAASAFHSVAAGGGVMAVLSAFFVVPGDRDL